jgi:hypothetical protein
MLAFTRQEAADQQQTQNGNDELPA